MPETNRQRVWQSKKLRRRSTNNVPSANAGFRMKKDQPLNNFCKILRGAPKIVATKRAAAVFSF
jgi:hypothetical protein